MLTRGTLTYIAQRLALIAFTLVAVSFLVFITVHSLPGSAFESERVHGKALQLLLHEYGLDRPVLVQYWSFLTNAIQGNLGVSFQIRGLPITPLVMRELSVSAELGGTALLITIGLGTTFGVLAALRQNTWVDYTLTSIAVVGYSVPSFVLAGLGVLIFSYWLPNRHQRRHLVPGHLDRDVRNARRAVPAGDHPGLLHVGPGHQDHPRGDARGAAAGLHPHRQGEGPEEPRRHRPACAAQRAHPGDQHPRAAGHQHHHRQRHHRDHLRHSRAGQGVRREHHRGATTTSRWRCSPSTLSSSASPTSSSTCCTPSLIRGFATDGRSDHPASSRNTPAGPSPGNRWVSGATASAVSAATALRSPP